MKRTQIYLTKEERQSLRIIADRLGQSQSELIRSAVDELIRRYEGGNRLALLKEGRGIWQDRQDLPDFQGVRQELDRSSADKD